MLARFYFVVTCIHNPRIGSVVRIQPPPAELARHWFRGGVAGELMASSAQPEGAGLGAKLG